MDKLDRYIEENTSMGTEAEDALLAELERATNLRAIQPKMLSGRVQGAFLRLVVRMLQPRTVLEIGTFTGYSALSIAAGLNDGAELHTVEVDDELEDFAQGFFARSPHGHKIHLHVGSALDVVPELVRELGRKPDLDCKPVGGFRGFDMVFIDGDKREYPDYLRMLMGDGNEDALGGAGRAGGASGDAVLGKEAKNGTPPMVHSGTIILADNVLWYGKVAEPEEMKSSDRHTAGILEFNRLVASDPRLENVILPLRDGINLIRVK